MGGNAFPGLDLRRIKSQEILPTLEYVAATLAFPEFDYFYLAQNLMGSAGKQPDSGDLDIGIDSGTFPRSRLLDISMKTRTVLSKNAVKYDGANSVQINTAWPILGDPANGRIQIDFIYGPIEFLKFSHYSPGTDVSPYKGVWISTLLGVLLKLKKEYEEFDETQLDPKTNEPMRVARVGWRYDLELGATRYWKMQKKYGQGMSEVSPDEFETKHPKAPRFGRVGFLTMPEDILQLIFGNPTKIKDVDTFEKMWAMTKRMYAHRSDMTLEDVKDRVAEAIYRSSANNKQKHMRILEMTRFFKRIDGEG